MTPLLYLLPLLSVAPVPAHRLAQDSPGSALILESLDGTVSERQLAGYTLIDPRDEGVVFVRYGGVADPTPPPGTLDGRAVVYLHGGDRVWCHVAGGEGEALSMLLHGGARLSLSVEEIASVLFPRRLPTDGSSEPEPPEQGDRLYLSRGRGLDKLDGLVNRFQPGGVVFEGRFGERTYPWDEVAALFVEDLGEAATEVPAVPVVVDLPDGGRLSGGLVAMDSNGVRIERAAGEVSLPPTVVREVTLNDGSFVFLSQLPVSDTGPVTLFGGADDLGMVYPHRVDRNCMDGPLRSGGRSWSRGIGVHAPSRLTWKLESGWKELRALAGVDDSVLRNEFPGTVTFRVLVDGQEVWTSPVLQGGDSPLVLPSIDLSGKRELVLEVQTATEAFVSDRANWLRPILIRG